MHSQMHYLPLAPGFFAILVGFFLIVLVLRSVRYAYESLGVSSNTAIFLLFATLIGSIFNIPIAELPPERAMSHHHVDFFGCATPCLLLAVGRAQWLRSMSAVQSFRR
jgi:uncharacterized membrane protein